MDEKEYKDTYDHLNQLRCVYEKCMTSLHGACSQGKMFRLADRHGFGCHSSVHQVQCSALLGHLRSKTKFVFKLHDIDGPLPHNKEIRVQNGGLDGLHEMVYEDGKPEKIEDVSQLISDAVTKYGGVEKIPYDQVMKSVMAYEARPKRRSRKS